MPSRKPASISVNLKDLVSGQALLGHTPGDKRKVTVTEMSPVINSNQLVIKGQAYGSKLYSITMSLFDVNYNKTKSANNPLTVDAADGQRFFAAQIPIKSARAQVRCSCLDFYYTWQYYDNKNKVLAGPQMKPYVRKTAHYPPRNPLKLPGCCKHIIEFVNRLKDLKILKD